MEWGGESHSDHARIMRSRSSSIAASSRQQFIVGCAIGATVVMALVQLLAAAPAGSPVTYVCALAYVDPHAAAEHLVEGRCTGTLAAEPRGRGGFGYDPAFVPDATGPDDNRTMSELSQGEKNEISHRGAAARLLSAHLSSGEVAPGGR